MQFWYIIAVSLVKLSVLFFYGRIFSARRLPIIIRIMVTVTIAWLISFLFATFFQIWPIWCNWVLCKPTTNYPLMYVLCSVTDIVLDISILCLPGFFIKDLQISRGKKVGVAGIFGLGILYVFSTSGSFGSKWMLNPSTSCIVASIARLVFSVEFIQEDPLAGFATNFDSRLPSRHSRISPLTRSSCGRQHHHVVRDRSLHVHSVCQPPLLQSAGGQSRPQPRLLLRWRPLRLLDRRRRLFFSLSLS